MVDFLYIVLWFKFALVFVIACFFLKHGLL